MSIAEHLTEAKRLIVAATDAPELQEAQRHLEEVAKREPKIPELIRLNRMGTAAAIQIAEKKRDAESKQHPQIDEAFVKCRSAVRGNLKAPSTADFAPYSRGSVIDLGKWQYRVQSYVDAENSFGAHLRSSFTSTVKCTGINECMVTQLSMHQRH
jgi:hypothetical protein